MPHQVIVRVVKKQLSTGDTVNCVESIRNPQDNVCYLFRDQVESHHVELFQLATVKNATRCLRKTGQYRNLNVTLPDELIGTYMDADYNFVFNSVYLEECDIQTNANKTSAGALPEGLAEMLSSFKDRDTVGKANLTDVKR